MRRTLYMVVEHFKNKDAVAVYRRFRDSGRLAPEGSPPYIAIGTTNGDTSQAHMVG